MLDRLLGLLGTKRRPRAPRAAMQEVQGLALYQFSACPYCVRVRRAIKRLGLRIELRDAHLPVYRQELRLQGGRYQTPCLRIDSDAGETRWLYESAHIIRYLEQRFSNPPS